jgi:hypothetical protein
MFRFASSAPSEEGGDQEDKDFHEYLKEAKETDLSDIDRTGCVSQGRDMKNDHVIIMIPHLGINKVDKPEVSFRKMLLLFLLKTNEMVGAAYSVVYAHTPVDLMNQYPLIYKFYSILPRAYKKNLQKMYIIHPNMGIRMFFEFARVFLSHKFYNKLCLLESIIDFQKIIFPTQLSLPLKFLRREDEDREYRYLGRMPPLLAGYDPKLGTMTILAICAEFLRANHGLQSSGIFRVPGDEAEITLSKIRLQHGYHTGDERHSYINLSENKNYIIVGNLDALYGWNGAVAQLIVSPGTVVNASTSHHHGHGHGHHKDGTGGGGGGGGGGLGGRKRSVFTIPSESNQHSPKINHNTSNPNLKDPTTTTTTTSSSTAAGTISAPNAATITTNNNTNNNEKAGATGATDSATNSGIHSIADMSIVTLQNVNTVAELFKVSIRDMPEPLVPEAITRDLLNNTRSFGVSDLTTTI